MSVGYGRGHYGSEQLAPRPRGRSGRGWFVPVVMLGVGAVVIWYMMPSDKCEEAEEPTASPPPPFPPQPPPYRRYDTPVASVEPAVTAAEAAAEIDQLARSRGFASTMAYEDSVVDSARQLKVAGAQVTLGPHLDHLAPRLGTP